MVRRARKQTEKARVAALYADALFLMQEKCAERYLSFREEMLKMVRQWFVEQGIEPPPAYEDPPAPAHRNGNGQSLRISALLANLRRSQDQSS